MEKCVQLQQISLPPFTFTVVIGSILMYWRSKMVFLYAAFVKYPF
jgi:hypothetical protein